MKYGKWSESHNATEKQHQTVRLTWNVNNNVFKMCEKISEGFTYLEDEAALVATAAAAATEKK